MNETLSTFEKKWLTQDIRLVRKDLSLVEAAIAYDLMQCAIALHKSTNNKKYTHIKRHALRSFCKQIGVRSHKTTAGSLTVNQIRSFINNVHNNGVLPDSIKTLQIDTIIRFIYFLVINNILDHNVYDRTKYDL